MEPPAHHYGPSKALQKRAGLGGRQQRTEVLRLPPVRLGMEDGGVGRFELQDICVSEPNSTDEEAINASLTAHTAVDIRKSSFRIADPKHKPC